MNIYERMSYDPTFRGGTEMTKVARLHRVIKKLIDACELAVERLEVCNFHGDEEKFIEEIESVIKSSIKSSQGRG
jgi:hypothetical protein